MSSRVPCSREEVLAVMGSLDGRVFREVSASALGRQVLDSACGIGARSLPPVEPQSHKRRIGMQFKRISYAASAIGALAIAAGCASTGQRATTVESAGDVNT